jgi:hypothetical protein
MARCAVPARVQRAEGILDDMRIKAPVAPLNAARTAQRAIRTRNEKVALRPADTDQFCNFRSHVGVAH